LVSLGELDFGVKKYNLEVLRMSKGKNRVKSASFVSVCAILVSVAVLWASSIGNAEGAVLKDQDVVIPISEITTSAKFYPVVIDGTRMEIIAVKAPDGSIRTAFNTCQVCFDSGRGYYVQEGSALVCQNCGNRFGMNQVEVVSGGCNPVPIFPKNKVVSEENITIPKEFLKETKVVFANWKREY
jgi:uncharacterized membrane protein